MIKVVRIIYSVLLVAFITVLNASETYAKIGDYTMVCGKNRACNTASSKCIVCEERHVVSSKDLGYSGFNAGVYDFFSFFVPDILEDEILQEVFYCVDKDYEEPSHCRRSATGGVKGKTEILYTFWFDQTISEGTACVTSNFYNMYTASCFGCEITKILASAFINAAAKAEEVSQKAGYVILTVATLIWIAIFVLKNVSSFATVEPRQMIQQLMVQLFKVLLAFVLISSGFKTILHYTMEPLMIAGTDFADAILVSENHSSVEQENK